MDNLLKTWRNRYSWMLTYAEEAHFAGNYDKENHFATCARQWYNAIRELELELGKEKVKCTR